MLLLTDWTQKAEGAALLESEKAISDLMPMCTESGQAQRQAEATSRVKVICHSKEPHQRKTEEKDRASKATEDWKRPAHTTPQPSLLTYQQIEEATASALELLAQKQQRKRNFQSNKLARNSAALDHTISQDEEEHRHALRTSQGQKQGERGYPARRVWMDSAASRALSSTS